MIPGTFWLLFADQWDPKSPWADRRVRLAANLAIDRQAINQAETLGFSRITGSIIPQDFEFAWPAPLYPHDPKQATRSFSRRPGTRTASTPGRSTATRPTKTSRRRSPTISRPWAFGLKLRPLERVAFFTQLREKKLSHVIQIGSAAFGNAATRIDAFVAAAGIYTYGTYPDIEGIIQEQASGVGREAGDGHPHDPAAHARQDHVRPDLGARLPQWRRTARGGVRASA